jgi:hypothetical protein
MFVLLAATTSLLRHCFADDSVIAILFDHHQHHHQQQQQQSSSSTVTDVMRRLHAVRDARLVELLDAPRGANLVRFVVVVAFVLFLNSDLSLSLSIVDVKPHCLFVCLFLLGSSLGC